MGNEVVATCTIYRKDWEHPFVHSVLLSEYDQQNKMWKEKPVTMIKKVATEQAFRLCFPDEMGGLPYGEEELPQDNPEVNSFEPSPNVRNVTPSKVSDTTPKKLYTKEQADNFSKLMNTKLPNGADAFTQEEKESYKQMLKDGLYEDALESASKVLDARESAANPSDEEIEQEIF